MAADVMPTAGLAMTIPYLVCAFAYSALVTLILVQAQRSRTGLLLAAAGAATAAWAATTALIGLPLQGAATTLDLLHSVAWYYFCLHLYRRAVTVDPADTLFVKLGILSAVFVVIAMLTGMADLSGGLSLFSAGLLLRLGLAICQLLLLENLFRSTSPDQRWHVGLACIALGGMAAYDFALCADAVLLHAASPTMVAGRAVVAILVTPLLAVAAARNRSWRIDIHISRTAAFHSATLVVSGVFLISLAAAGEIARRLGAPFGGDWGSLAEIALVFAGIITVAVLITSGSARSLLRRRLVDHFFTLRYDYRREWQHCIDVLSAAGAAPLSNRVINAVADAVDSPCGLLFTREPGQAGLTWAGAWNTLPATALPPTDPLAAEMLAAAGPRELTAKPSSEALPPDFQPWLIVPLPDPRAEQPLGWLLLARPRAAFPLDDEVFELLRILAHEVATHLAQERALASLLEARDLRAYGERFAFVAHDIKNVSSQLTLLLSNAETYLDDPEFQKDMLSTVRASVSRIGGLIRRLEPRDAAAPPDRRTPRVAAASALRELLASRVTGRAMVALEIDQSCESVTAAMEPHAFTAAVTHLLDNAITAAAHTGPSRPGGVRLSLRLADARAVIDITDRGPGMTAEFIHAELFKPFATRTEGGSGIGAFQARELVRAAGGELLVTSKPGHGTTMRLSLPLADALPAGSISHDRRVDNGGTRTDDKRVSARL
jgi:putative PEP-CTERM system histidine kinase